jgi:hypothetical protein
MKIKNKIFTCLIFIIFATTIANANIENNVEHFFVNKKLKEQILLSPFKLSLHQKDGKEIIAYLFAEDEQSEPFEDLSCVDSEERKTILKSGHYYIYLRDKATDIFLPFRTPIFTDFSKVNMNVQGADFFIFPPANKNQSDILLISQFISCSGDQYEAYGFSENQQYLVPYIFTGKKQEEAFFGHIDKSEPCDHCFLAYTRIEPMIYVYQLSRSNIPGEIRQELLNKVHI